MTMICRKCNRPNGLGLEDMKTGVITSINICNECLFHHWDFKPVHYDMQFDLTIDQMKEIMKKTEEGLIND